MAKEKVEILMKRFNPWRTELLAKYEASPEEIERLKELHRRVRID